MVVHLLRLRRDPPDEVDGLREAVELVGLRDGIAVTLPAVEPGQAVVDLLVRQSVHAPHVPADPPARVGRAYGVGAPPDEERDLRELPMFPLGSVLLPYMPLRLQVFEPRYRSLVEDVLAADREFGVVLIERGHEVGGGDVRTDLGTVARIMQSREVADGRWLLVTVGYHRFRVERWLPDAPYPRAEVHELADPPAGPADVERYEEVAARLRRVLAMRAELGEPAPPATRGVTPDPVLGTFQVATLADLGPMDKQRLLAAADVSERLEVLVEALDDLSDALAFRLGGSHDPGERG